MALWYVADSGLNAMGGQLTATSLLTTVTASATVNVVGAWVQMHAATTFPVSGLMIHLGKTGLAVAATNAQVSFDIGIGPNGSETAIINDVAVGGSLAFFAWWFPISIPVGSRIAVRLRSLVASKSTTMAMSVYGGGFGLEAGYKAVTYGAVTTGSRGTILTSPASINTKAAWTVITAAVTSPARWIVVGLTSPNTTIATAIDGLLDVGMGGAGAEAVIIPDISFGVSANEEVNHANSLTFPVNVPVGARLVARYQATSTASTGSPSVTLTGVG